MKIEIKLLDETSGPSKAIKSALASVDAEVKALTKDFGALEAKLKNVVGVWLEYKKAVDATGVSLKKAADVSVQRMKDMETAALRTSKALKELQALGKHGGGRSGEHAEHKEKAEGLYGALTGALAGSALYLTARELAEGFEYLNDKLAETARIEDSRRDAARSAGISNPEKFAEELSKSLEGKIPLSQIFDGLEIIKNIRFKKGQEDNAAARLIEGANRAGGGVKGDVDRILSIYANAAANATIRPKEQDFLRKIAEESGYKGKILFPKNKNEEARQTAPEIAKLLLSPEVARRPIPETASHQAELLKEAGEDAYKATANSKEYLEVLKEMTNIWKDKDLVKDYAAAQLKLITVEKDALESISNILHFINTGETPAGKRERDGADQTDMEKAMGIKKAPHHAEGGVTTQGHYAVVGEGGPEVILPLSKAAGVLSQALSKASGGTRGSVNVSPGAVVINVTTQPGQSNDEISKRISDLVPVLLNQAFESMSIQATGGIP